jgi:hypothetical protein
MKAALPILLIMLLFDMRSVAQARQRKTKSFGSFTVVSDSFNTELGLWYQMRIVVKRDTFIIEDLFPDNGSEFDIRPSADRRYFVIDNIIKGYFEEDGNREPYEKYKCVIVDVRLHRVVHEMQSDCDGAWSKANTWISGGTVVFAPSTK